MRFRCLFLALAAAWSLAFLNIGVFGQEFKVSEVGQDLPASPERTLSGECPGFCCACEPTWTVNVGSTLLHRSTARAATLVQDGQTSADRANIADFDLGWAAGPRIEISRRLSADWEIGVEYFSVDGWRASRSLSDPGNLRVPFVSDDPADFFDTAEAQYSSRLYSTEIMAKRRLTDCVRVLAGFRMIQLHESVSARADSVDLSGSFAINTGNYLYGFQTGLDTVLWDRGGPFQLKGLIKAGVYGNQITGSMHGEGTDFSAEGTASMGRTSFVGEVGLIANYRFNQHWSVFGGYQALWIDGVALAPDTFSADNQNQMIGGSPFYHGASAGIVLTW